MRKNFINKLIPNEGTITYDDWFQRGFNQDSKRTIRL